jgi:hypothetical protein
MQLGWCTWIGKRYETRYWPYAKTLAISLGNHLHDNYKMIIFDL